MSVEPEWIPHRGGCHCAAVRFEAMGPADLEALECNCSICARTGYQHWIVERDAFCLLSGEEMLTTYTFNTGVAQHFFCRRCGIKAFYVPRSHPDAYSVNPRCLDPGSVRSLRIVPFDGAHWEEAVSMLRTAE